ncbi:MAG TPA: EamA family transporter [Thermococcus sp.]|nr:EamA family transporter [Thermococcus sp.]
MRAYIFYAILSAFFAPLVPIFGKLGLKDVDSTVATTVRAFIMFAFLFLVAVWQGRTDVSSINGRALLFIALSGIAGALSWLFYFMAVKGGRVPAVIAIDKTSVALAIFLSWIVLKEELTPRTVLGALLIVVGALLVSL